MNIAQGAWLKYRYLKKSMKSGIFSRSKFPITMDLTVKALFVVMQSPYSIPNKTSDANFLRTFKNKVKIYIGNFYRCK